MDVNKVLCDVNLELHTEALQELCGGEQVAYQDVRVWGRTNHLVVRSGTANQRPIDYGRRVVWELPLLFLVHPHAECQFRYVRLSVDFRRDAGGAAQAGVQVEDLSPRHVEGKDPVRILTKRSGELSFELEMTGVEASVTAEASRESQVYFPVVRGSKIVSGLAVWDFEPLPGAPLHVERELRLLVSGPASASEKLHAEVRVEARVSVTGLRGLVPLIGQRPIDLTTILQFGSRDS